MSDIHQLQRDQSDIFTLPYGQVLVFGGVGTLSYAIPRAGGTVQLSLLSEDQSLGPLDADIDCRISAAGAAHYRILDLQDLSLTDLHGIAVPIGTIATVVDGQNRVPVYWTGTEWAPVAGVATLPTAKIEILVANADTIAAFIGRRNFVFIVDMADGTRIDQLTIMLPSDSDSYDNQIGNYFFRQAVGSLNWVGPENVVAPNSVNRNGWITIRRVEAGEWVKPSDS